MHEGNFSVDDLRPVLDSRKVEHIGGPNDGDYLAVSSSGLRANGIYVAVNESVVVAKRFVPFPAPSTGSSHE